MNSIHNDEDLNDPLFDPPYDKSSEPKDEDGYDSDKETLPEKLVFPLGYLAKKFRAGSMKGSIFTLMTATIGTGILLIPNSISQSGIAWGLMQMLFCGWLGYYSLMLVIRSSEKAKVFSYQELAEITLGNWFRQSVNVVFFFANWGTAIAYLVLVSQLIARALGIFFGQGKLLPDWMTDPTSPIWPIVVATLFVLPLSLAKELKSLRYFCLINFGFILFLGFVVVYESFKLEDFSTSVDALKLFVFSGTSTTFSTSVFAYLSHPNVLDVFKELHNSTKRRMRKIILRTTILVFLIYSLVGSFGYITFAQNLDILRVKANGVILFAYGYDIETGAEKPYPPLTVIALLLIGLSVIVATPLCIKPAKDGLSDIFRKQGTSPQQKDSTLKHCLLVIFTIYTGVIIGIVTPSMQDIISILGSSFFTIICFIMPPLFYIKLSPKSGLWGHKLICWIMLVVFGIFTIVSTYANVMEAVNKK